MSMPNMKVPVKPKSFFHKLVHAGSKVDIGKTLRKRRSSLSTHSRSTRLSDESLDLCTSSSLHSNFLEKPQQEFEIVNQNEFVDNVLIGNCSDMDCIVHFSNEESQLSFDVEDHLLELLRDGSKKKFDLYHINSGMAPYFTSKLDINKEEPTLLRFKNGKLIGRISFVSFESCFCNLEQWLKDSEQRDDFGSLSTLKI